jgi:hypothetical protein
MISRVDTESQRCNTYDDELLSCMMNNAAVDDHDHDNYHDHDQDHVSQNITKFSWVCCAAIKVQYPPIKSLRATTTLLASSTYNHHRTNKILRGSSLE